MYVRGEGQLEVIERQDDLNISRSKVIINSTQKISSRVLKSWNMMSVARTSYKSSLWLSLVAMNSTDNPNPGYQQSNRVLLDLLQPLQLVLDLHIDVRLLKRAPNDSPYAIALSLTPSH